LRHHQADPDGQDIAHRQILFLREWIIVLFFRGWILGHFSHLQQNKPTHFI